MSDSFVTPWIIACQVPLSMGFPRQESWSGLPFPPPGDLPDPGIKPTSPALAGRFFTTEPAGSSFQSRSRVQLCDPVDCGPPSSSVHGVSQARALAWGAISSSRGSSRPRNRTCICLLLRRQVLYHWCPLGRPSGPLLLLLLLLSRFSRVRLCATPQTAAHQAPPSLGFSRQEH